MYQQAELAQVAHEVVGELIRAARPLFIFGAGAKDWESARRIMNALNVPCVTTWGAADRFGDHANWYGSFGTHGVRGANLAVQNADYIVSIGSRLDTKATGAPASSFAPQARLVMVDIDEAELGKMPKIGRPLYRSILADNADFLRHLLPTASEYASLNQTNDANAGYTPPWIAQLRLWRDLYPPGPQIPTWHEDYAKPDPYRILAALSDELQLGDVIVSDTGCCLAWAMQAMKWKGQRFIHAFNQTPMGYGLPAAIGAAFATGKRVVLLTGDGGLMVNIGELATVAAHNLPIKIILFENRSHSMCLQTQRQWLEGRYSATSEGDLSFPDFQWVAGAFGLHRPLTLGALLEDDKPAFWSVRIDREQGVTPQIKYGEPLA